MAKKPQKTVLIPLDTLKVLLQGADIALEKGADRLHNYITDALLEAERIIAESKD